MSLLGKISLLLSALALAMLFSVRFFLGGWVDFLWIFVGIFVVGLVLGLILDIKVILEFLSMRTTKHGMNMGVLILLVLVLLVAINYLGNRFNKSFDLTEEKINSLSPQSTEILKNLTEDLQVKVFYKQDERANNMRQAIRMSLAQYQESSPKIKLQQIDAYADNVQSQAYLNELPDRDRELVFVFAEYKGKKVRLEAPFQEEQITSALVKVTRQGSKHVYFVTGHGEKEIESEAPEGLKAFKQALDESSYQSKSLNLAVEGKIPEDADIVAVIGPVSPLLPTEMAALKAYAERGGRLLIAADPGQRHNLGELTKVLGVEFENNYIIDMEQYRGRGSPRALGITFDPNHAITKPFGIGNMSLFDLASELRVTPQANASLKAVELVKTPESSFTITEMTAEAKRGQGKAMALVIAVSGHLKDPSPKILEADKKKEDKKDKPAEPAEASSPEFASVVVGDSDFLANRAFFQGLNRDLAMNSLAYLAKEADLISIRPRQMKATKMIMTPTISFIMVISGIVLPLLFLVTSVFLWFRRRGA